MTDNNDTPTTDTDTGGGDDTPAVDPALAAQVETLTSELAKIKKLAEERPPSTAEQIEQQLVDLGVVKQEAVDARKASRRVADAASELQGEFAKMKTDIRLRDLTDAARDAGAHNPAHVASMLMSEDADEQPAELVAKLRADKASGYMFKTPTEPEIGGGGRAGSMDSAVAAIVEQIRADI